MPDEQSRELSVRRIAPRKGRMDNDRFQLALRSDRRALDPDWDAHVRWWRGVIGRGRTGAPFPTLALSYYRSPGGSPGGRRIQSFSMVSSDTLTDEAVSAAIQSLEDPRRADVLARGFGGKPAAHGFPFRFELLVLDPMMRVLMSPYGGVSLPVSLSDATWENFDPRAICISWLTALGISEPIDPRWVKLPCMTHDLSDGVWRLLCLVDLRDSGLGVTAEDIRDVLVGPDRGFDVAPATRHAMRGIMSQAADSPSGAARVTTETILSYLSDSS